MILRHSGSEWSVDETMVATFGRSHDRVIPVGLEPRDATISREAGELRRTDEQWQVINTGSRSFFLVEPGGEVEIAAPGSGRSAALIAHDYVWLRLPGEAGDHAVEVELALDELPDHQPTTSAEGADEATNVEAPIQLTDNEQRSVVAVYESYLQLPPRYRREPRSLRAAAARLGVEEGKVKADLRRVQDKVATAGGPAPGGVRHRDVLISWLMARGVIDHRLRSLLQ